jgi:hypothetical protein
MIDPMLKVITKFAKSHNVTVKSQDVFDVRLILLALLAGIFRRENRS